MNWVEIMDIGIATVVGSMIGIIGTLIVTAVINHRGYKDIQKMIGKNTDIPLAELHHQLADKIGNTERGSLTFQHEQIVQKILDQLGDSPKNTAETNFYVKELVSQYNNDLNRRNQLNHDYTKIVDSVTQLQDFAEIFINLVNENQKLSIENQDFKQRIKELEKLLEQQKPSDGPTLRMW